MPRFLQVLGFALVLLVGPAARGEIPPLAQAMADKVLGRADAPVTMIEYSSLGCPHCAAFHRETLPKIRKAYIDTGKVRLVYRDFPLGTVALAASMVARCAPPPMFFGLVEVLFREQQTWTRSGNPVAELTRIARQAALSKADVEACLRDRDLMNAIRDVAQSAERKFAIAATPTFLINGTKVEGARSFEEFKAVIDKELDKKN